MWVRFDDYAEGPDGVRVFEGSTVLVLRTHWFKVVEQGDFHVDTERITAFDRRLQGLGVEAVAAHAA